LTLFYGFRLADQGQDQQQIPRNALRASPPLFSKGANSYRTGKSYAVVGVGSGRSV
jgi:hypothetical protein